MEQVHVFFCVFFFFGTVPELQPCWSFVLMTQTSLFLHEDNWELGYRCQPQASPASPLGDVDEAPACEGCRTCCLIVLINKFVSESVLNFLFVWTTCSDTRSVGKFEDHVTPMSDAWREEECRFVSQNKHISRTHSWLCLPARLYTSIHSFLTDSSAWLAGAMTKKLSVCMRSQKMCRAFVWHGHRAHACSTIVTHKCIFKESPDRHAQPKNCAHGKKTLNAVRIISRLTMAHCRQCPTVEPSNWAADNDLFVGSATIWGAHRDEHLTAKAPLSIWIQWWRRRTAQSRQMAAPRCTVQEFYHQRIGASFVRIDHGLDMEQGPQFNQ